MFLIRASSGVVFCLTIFFTKDLNLFAIFIYIRQRQALVYSEFLSTKMLVVKLVQNGNCCLAKSDAMLSLAQVATGNASLANDGIDSDSGITFQTYTACTQILVVGKALVTFSWFLLWITTSNFAVV